MSTIPATEVQRLQNALPFWLSLGMVPVAILGALLGGATVALLPVYSWVMFSVLDALFGLNTDNPDPQTPEAGLFWYRLVTLIWVPIQFALLCWMLWSQPYGSRHGKNNWLCDWNSTHSSVNFITAHQTDCARY